MSKIKVSYRPDNGGHKSLYLTRREIVALVKKFAREADGKRDKLNQMNLVEVDLDLYERFTTQVDVSRLKTSTRNPELRVTVAVVGIGCYYQDPRLFFTKSLYIDEKDWVYSGVRGNEAGREVSSLLSFLPNADFWYAWDRYGYEGEISLMDKVREP
jgi:hypothetical protein